MMPPSPPRPYSPQPPPLPDTTAPRVEDILSQPVLNGENVIHGTEGMTIGQVEDDVLRGGRFRVFPWSFSIVVMSFRRSSPITYVRSNESVGAQAWLWTLPTLFLGWWGIPWGIAFTLMNFYRNCMGGTELTTEVLSHLVGPARALSVISQAQPRNTDAALWLLRLFIIGVPVGFFLLISMLARN